MAVAGPDNVTTARRVAVAASLPRRLAAYFVDSLIDGAVIPVLIAFDRRSGFGAGLVVAVTLVVMLTIVIVNELVLVTRTGQSIGKRWLGIRVVDSTTMQPPGGWQIFWRFSVQSAAVGVGWHPFGGAVMFVVGPWPLICAAPALFDTQWHRGLHDRLAHTVVIDVRGEQP